MSFAISVRIHSPRFLRSGLTVKSRLTIAEPDFSVNLTVISITPMSFSAVAIRLRARDQLQGQIRILSWQSTEISSRSHPKHIICLRVGIGQFIAIYCNGWVNLNSHLAFPARRTKKGNGIDGTGSILLRVRLVIEPVTRLPTLPRTSLEVRLVVSRSHGKFSRPRLEKSVRQIFKRPTLSVFDLRFFSMDPDSKSMKDS
jgi:hypothetical protein